MKSCRTFLCKQFVMLISFYALLSHGQSDPAVLRDKTLVAWVAPANETQHGGSVLTIDDGNSHFDGIIFGEIAPAKR